MPARRDPRSKDTGDSLERRIARDLHMLGALTREVLEGDVTHGESKATFSQVVLLRWLEAGGPRRTREVARFLGATSAAASQLLSRLRAKGLIEGLPDPRDGRAELLRSTARGRAFVERHRGEVTQRMEALLGRVSQVDRLRLAEGLEAVLDLLLGSGIALEHLCLHCHALAAPGCLMVRHGRHCPTRPEG